jgi:hypothetical protein
MNTLVIVFAHDALLRIQGTITIEDLKCLLWLAIGLSYKQVSELLISLGILSIFFSSKLKILLHSVLSTGKIVHKTRGISYVLQHESL